MQNNIMGRIFVSYTLAVLLAASIFYKLIPVLLNYAPGYSYIDELHGLSYARQYIIIMLLTLLIGYLIIYFFLRGIKEGAAQKHLLITKKKLMNLPYQIYIIQIIVPVIAITLVVVPIFIIEKASLLSLIKIFILVATFFTLVSLITLVISKGSFNKLLLQLDSAAKVDEARIPLVYKLFLQILPMFIVAILFTSLIGYSKNIDDKGDLTSEAYLIALKNVFSHYQNELLNLNQITSALADVKDINNLDITRFVITPDGNVVTSNNEGLGDYFLGYLWQLSLHNGGYVYDVTKEIRGVIINVPGENGNYIVGIKFNVASMSLVVFYTISFAFILLLCSVVLYFLSKAISNDILTVAIALDEMASGEYINSDNKLPLTSNDEISDLVIAFNKIQDLVKRNIKQIQIDHEILIQQERLASLGQLIGGIAHSLKTPISTASDTTYCIENLASEYDQSIDVDTVTKEDHHSIAAEIKSHVKDLKETINYINSTINMVKNHSADIEASIEEKFSIKDLIKGIKILMSNELKKHNCKLNLHTNMLDGKVLTGDIRSLIQVMNVMISNSIQAYPEGNGQIDLSILKVGNSMEIIVQDYGIGIAKDIQNKLLNKMVTTKGVKGTGIGLYIANTIIKAKFNGILSFASEEGKGTKFIITFPLKKGESNED